MRTVYLGTSSFAAVVLEEIASRAQAPALVLTRPDRPRGRGRQLASPPVHRAAEALGIPVLAPESVNGPETHAAIAAVAPEAVCVCAFGALIKEPLLSSWPLLNVHPSPLPRWRGAAPVERAIMAGDRHTGVSIMRIGEGLDDGPVCLAERVAIGPDDTYGTLADRLAPLGAELLVRALRERPPFAEQDEAAATYAAKIGAADRALDPGRAAVDLERVVRALTPHIGARLRLADAGILGVGASRVLEEGARAGAQAGTLFARDGRLILACAEGELELLEVKPAGGRSMDAAAYLRGHAGSLARADAEPH